MSVGISVLKALYKNVSFRAWAAAFVILCYATFLHMGPSLTQCSQVVLGKPGDHTAGIMYNGWAAKRNPIAGYSAMTNYPYGEDLFQPVTLTSLIPTGAHFALTKITNITCAWNILVFTSYMSGGLAMFGLLIMLTKNFYVSIFGAYAISYTPYHAFASHGQIAGLINAGFILAIWQFLRMLRHPSTKNALLLGTAIGVNFYIDGYFILFGAVLLASFWGVVAVLKYRPGHKKTLLISQAKALLITTIVSVGFLAPLVWTRVHYAERISSFLGGTRSSIEQDAQQYSAEPYMYLLPPKTSPLGGQVSGTLQREVFSKDSEPGLLFVGLSITVLAVVATAETIRKRHVKRTKESYMIYYSQLTAVAVGGLAFLVSLQPHLKIGSLSLPMPSLAIIKITDSWRVFGRLYALVAICAVMLAALGLYAILQKWPRHRLMVFVLIFMIMALELRSFYTPSQREQYDRRTAPPVYNWLNDQPDVVAVAEYPLDEPPQGKYLTRYYTYQTISNKPLLNSMLPNSPYAGLRRSLSGLNDPQTIPVLRSLGINFLNVRPPTGLETATLQEDSLEKLFSYTNEDETIDSYRILSGKGTSYAFVMPDLQYFQINVSAGHEAAYSLGKHTRLSMLHLPTPLGSRSNSVVEQTASFELSAVERPRNIAITQNGRVLWSGVVGTQRQLIHFQALPDRDITLEAEDRPEELDRLILQLYKPQVNE